MQPQVAELSRSEFYGMECGEPELKARTAEFARERSLRWLPTFDHQIQANKLRAYFIQEWSEVTGARFDWHVQALSSANEPASKARSTARQAPRHPVIRSPATDTPRP